MNDIQRAVDTKEAAEARRVNGIVTRAEVTAQNRVGTASGEAIATDMKERAVQRHRDALQAGKMMIDHRAGIAIKAG